MFPLFHPLFNNKGKFGKSRLSYSPFSSISIPTKNISFNIKQKKAGAGLPYGVDTAFQTPVGNSSLIASHSNEYPGMLFKNIGLNDILYATNYSGETKSYRVTSIDPYKYTNPFDPYSGSLIWDKHIIPWENLPNAVTRNPDNLNLYASISQFKKYSPVTGDLINNERSIGLRFITASPINETAQHPSPRLRKIEPKTAPSVQVKKHTAI